MNVDIHNKKVFKLKEEAKLITLPSFVQLTVTQRSCADPSLLVEKALSNQKDGSEV
jgi:hypothetical protein